MRHPLKPAKLGHEISVQDLSGIVKELKKERDRVEKQLSGLNAALVAAASIYGGTAKPRRKRRKDLFTYLHLARNCEQSHRLVGLAGFADLSVFMCIGLVNNNCLVADGLSMGA